MKPVIIEHPLIQYKISLLRDKGTGTKEFRELVHEISLLMGYEATRDLPLTKIELQTPLTQTMASVIGKKIAIISILRAGLGMESGMLELIPAAKVGHIGMFRDKDTLRPVEYYCKLPANLDNSEVILIDPMLATGGSVVHAINILKNYGAKNIRFMCIIASPEGVSLLEKNHPDVSVFCGALDKCLNENGYILPGLGDAGDRIFGTK